MNRRRAPHVSMDTLPRASVDAALDETQFAIPKISFALAAMSRGEAGGPLVELLLRDLRASFARIALALQAHDRD